MFDRLEDIVKHYEELMFELNNPSVAEDQKRFRKLMKEQSDLTPLVETYKEYKQAIWEYEGVKIRYVRFFKLPGTRRFENIGKSLYRALKCLDLDFKQYDVFHADAPLPAGVATMLLSQCYHIPYIVHCHGLDVFFDVDYKKEKNCNKIVESFHAGHTALQRGRSAAGHLLQVFSR